MELGKHCKNRKEVKESIIDLEAKKKRLEEMVKSKNDELAFFPVECDFSSGEFRFRTFLSPLAMGYEHEVAI